MSKNSAFENDAAPRPRIGPPPPDSAPVPRIPAEQGRAAVEDAVRRAATAAEVRAEEMLVTDPPDLAAIYGRRRAQLNPAPAAPSRGGNPLAAALAGGFAGFAIAATAAHFTTGVVDNLAAAIACSAIALMFFVITLADA